MGDCHYDSALSWKGRVEPVDKCRINRSIKRQQDSMCECKDVKDSHIRRMCSIPDPSRINFTAGCIWKLWWGTQGCCSFSSSSSVANPKESQKIKCVNIQRHPRLCKRHHLCHNLTSEQGSCKPLGNRHKKIFKPFTASSEGKFDDLNETSDET